MPRPGRFTAGNQPVSLVQEAGWSPGPVWTGAGNPAPIGFQSPHSPTRSESLHRMSYPGRLLDQYVVRRTENRHPIDVHRIGTVASIFDSLHQLYFVSRV